MDRMTVFKELVKIGVVPVIRGERTADARVAVEALAAGGIAVAEVTMTVPGAVTAIGELVVELGDRVIIGAGTVTDPETCAQVIGAGCRFVVTPVLNPEIIALCRRADVCLIGGALTPTEIFNTHRAGADAVKVFPAAALGGAAYLRMLREPFPHIPLVPTGGVNLNTLGGFFEAGAVFVGAGGDLVSKDALKNGDTRRITARARQYVEALQTFRSA